jgi:hypothetical protein
MFVVSLAAGLPLSAQSITQASPGIMRFEDTNGTSFRYPATWTFTEQAPWQFPMSIQPSLSSESQIRGRIFTHSLPGVRQWPVTSFSGAEFGYDAREVHSVEACRALVLTANPDGKVDQLTIHGVSYWHGRAAQAGMSQITSDDIYAAVIGPQPAGGSCLLFDLAVHDVTAPGADTPPRPYTPREKSIIHGTLMKILASVRIPAQSR